MDVSLGRVGPSFLIGQGRGLSAWADRDRFGGLTSNNCFHHCLAGVLVGAGWSKGIILVGTYQPEQIPVGTYYLASSS